MINRTITLLAFTLLILSIPSLLQAQTQNSISFNPDTGTPYQYEIQLKVTRGSSRYFNLTNQLTFSKINEGYQLTETIDKFAILSGDKLKFNLSASFTEGAKLQKAQDFFKTIKIATKLSEKGVPLAPGDYSYNTDSNLMSSEEIEKDQKILGMFSRQSQPFYTSKALTKDVEFSRRALAPAFFQKNDSTYYRTDYKVLRKTDSTTILSYQRGPESIKKGQRKSKIHIKGMVVVENKTGMLLHRREVLKGFDLMKYQLVINRKDVQRLSLKNPYLDSNTYMADFEHYKKKPDTLSTEQIKRLYSKPKKLPDSFKSEAVANRYIHSLQPFLYYRKFRYSQSGQLLHKNVDNKRFISGQIKWLKGFDASGERVFISNFLKEELPFTVPQGRNKGVRKVPEGQFIIPKKIDSLRGSLEFYTEIGTQARKLTQEEVGKKLDLPNMNFKLTTWNDSTISYLGFGGLFFFDNQGNQILPKQATAVDHYVSQLTTLLGKDATELTNDDFFLYSNIDGIPDYVPHHTLQFKEPVQYVKLLIPKKVHSIKRTFTIEER